MTGDSCNIRGLHVLEKMTNNDLFMRNRPTSLATMANGGVWIIDDTPILLHTFEYIVRGALLNWWVSLVAPELN